MAFERDATVDAIRAIARPLASEDELDEVVGLVARKRLVLLGEATHGSHEFYDLRAAITRKLIVDHDFAAVCVEGDWPDAMRVDRYVRLQPGDDDDAIASLGGFERFPRWMWRNDDVSALVEWLRRHNASRHDAPLAYHRVGFYGLDLFSLHASMHAVLCYLDDVDPEAAARARERYACFDHAEGDVERYGRDAELGIGPKCETEVVAQLVEMQARKLARSGRTPAGDAWFHALQHAQIVRDAEAYYRTMFAGRSAAWNLRDTHMADTLDLLADHLGAGGPAKLVVWAHNSHVGDARAPDAGDDAQLTLGQLVRQRHPDQCALVGFTTFAGATIAADDWDAAPRRMRVTRALDGSWEAALHATEHARCFLQGAALRRLVGDRDLLERAIGVIYRPHSERRSHYLHARLGEQFDVVVHVDATSEVEPLDEVDAPTDGRAGESEPPETYPSGV